MTSDDLDVIAAAWWGGDGSGNAFDHVVEILNDDHPRVPHLIAALAATAPPDALQYIGTSVVEDLAFQVEDGTMDGADALRLILDSGLAASHLFSMLTGAFAVHLRALDNLRGVPLSPAQTSWLLDDDAPNRWVNSGQTVLDEDRIRFVPGQTSWQAELARRHPLS